MFRCLLVSGVIALAMFAACPLAVSAGQLLYEQPRRSNLGTGDFWYSTARDNLNGGFKAFDNIPFDTAVVVDRFDWTGFWATLNAGDPTENAEAWIFSVHETAADGGVGTLVEEQVVSDDAVARNYLGRTTIFDTSLYEEHFDYEVNLTQFSLDAGEYWFSIRADLLDDEVGAFAWDPAQDGFGDGILRHGRPSNGNYIEKSGDRALALYGSIVPEPTSLAVVGLALTSLGFARRR